MLDYPASPFQFVIAAVGKFRPYQRVITSFGDTLSCIGPTRPRMLLYRREHDSTIIKGKIKVVSHFDPVCESIGLGMMTPEELPSFGTGARIEDCSDYDLRWISC